MGLPPWAASSSQLFVLITGANSGLGLGFCERLIDEFISTPSRDPTSHLILIITTRSPLKTRHTIARLRRRLKELTEYSKWAKEQKKRDVQQGKTYEPKDQIARVHFLGLELDLCNLPNVYEAARKINGEVGGLSSPDLLTAEGLTRYDGKGVGLKNIRIPRLDVFITNAGIGGWYDVNWPLAIYDVLTGMPESVTWPAFKLAHVGMTLNKRLQSTDGQGDSVDGESTQSLLNGGGHVKESKNDDEPALGSVFCANLFGHYILGHQLMPLLSSTDGRTDGGRGRLVFTSSIEAQARHLDEDDFQGLYTNMPYESSKRLTDILALTAHFSSVQKANKEYFALPPPQSADEQLKSESSQKPEVYLVHPGICHTDIMTLMPILAWLMRMAFYVARLCGSPWHPIMSYKGATAPVWLALADQSTLDAMEGRNAHGGSDRKIKWGSSTDRMGNERVRKTEVQGWGIGGAVGEQVDKKGRKKDAKDVTREEREEFEALGVRCWREMERMRKDWEERLGFAKG